MQTSHTIAKAAVEKSLKAEQQKLNDIEAQILALEKIPNSEDGMKLNVLRNNRLTKVLEVKALNDRLLQFEAKAA